MKSGDAGGGAAVAQWNKESFLYKVALTARFDLAVRR